MEGNREFTEPPQGEFKQGIQDDPIPQIAEQSWVNRFKNRLNGIFRKKKGGSAEWPSDLPQVSIDIFYTSHATAGDVEKMRKRFEEADVFIPESNGWKRSSLAWFRNLADGKLSREELNRFKFNTDWVSGVARMVENSSKPVTVIDLPRNRLFKKLDKLYSGSGSVKMGTFGSFLDSLRNHVHKVAELQKERDDYMVTQFPIRMRELLVIYPQLKEKKQIKVLLSLGSFHTSVYENMKEQGRNVNWEFSAIPYVDGFRVEAERRYLFGKDVSDELAANMFLEKALERDVLPHELATERYDEFVIFCRRVIPQFSFQDAEEVFNRIKQGEDRKKIFEDKLGQKGIKIPQTAQELHDFLAKPEQGISEVKS